MIQIRNISKRFFNVNALNDVSFDIPDGEVIGILGPNGAGKSTLLKIIAGVLNADTGSVKPTDGIWPEIVYKPDRLLYPNHLSVTNYLMMFAGLANLSGGRRREVVERALDQVSLSAAKHKRISELSKGMRQRLGLAQILIGDAPIILLDEPSNGLDPVGQQEILAEIRQLNRTGKTILISSHQLQEVTELCSQIIILSQGEIRYANSMQAALSVRPRIAIGVDRDTEPIAPLIKQLHPAIKIDGTMITIGEQAVHLRRQLLTLLLGAGYDIVTMEHHKTSLADIYREVVQ